MAEEFAGEKTEPATPRKRQEAREKGQVARSQDLSTALLMLAAFSILFGWGETLVEDMGSIVRSAFLGLGEGRLTFDNVVHHAFIGFPRLLLAVAPILVGLFALGFLVNVAQVGWFVSVDPLAPRIDKLNPLKGLQRIFSVRGLARLGFGILKLTIVGVVLYVSYQRLFDPERDENVFTLFFVDLPQAIHIANQALFHTGGVACLALLALALLDFAFQRWRHEIDLRMTKQEVKEEHKRMDGDPKLKERRRRVGQQLALQRMMLEVPKADVVITNPTHFACAIRYKEEEGRAPRLVAKGKDFLAQRIRQVAIDNEVPIVEDPPLARSIYGTTEIGEEIPPELYNQVARVLAYVYRLGRKPVGSGSERG
ncbi:MAG: flagellar biosynthesis protein FlhB [Planctomycetes bacterium]|nr:flagellar biosynthesis protein FlhB [Planctomycetota bacterium]